MYAVAWVIIDPSRTGQISSSEDVLKICFGKLPNRSSGREAEMGLALPRIMCAPSDHLLEASGCLSRNYSDELDPVKNPPILGASNPYGLRRPAPLLKLLE
jgi:hypothetical protein